MSACRGRREVDIDSAHVSYVALPLPLSGEGRVHQGGGPNGAGRGGGSYFLLVDFCDGTRMGFVGVWVLVWVKETSSAAPYLRS